MQLSTIDLEVERVDDDLVHTLVHVDLHLGGAAEGRRFEIGLQHEVVARRHSRAREPIAILHGWGAYRPRPQRAAKRNPTPGRGVTRERT
jgi:hypothetical protein